MNQKNILLLSMFMWEILLLLLFALFTVFQDYDDRVLFNSSVNGVDFYPMMKDVHVMVFIGFGFLLCFVRKYGFSGVGFNFLLAAFAVQWSMLCVGFFEGFGVEKGEEKWVRIILDVRSLITADFGAATVLISFGAVMGKASLEQLFVMMLIEVPFYALNQYIGVVSLGAVDVGGSIFIHTFGAYFGLLFSFFSTDSVHAKHHEENNSTYTSDRFAILGTLFLWIYWPSFNGALATKYQQHRVIVNTVLSLTSSCIFAYMTSLFLRKEKLFSMIDIQNATLAGGVAVGSCSNVVIQPWVGFLIGSLAGFLSVFGDIYVQPWLERKFKLFDTAGVHNRHGIPGILGGISGAFAALAGSETLGINIAVIFPNMAPSNGTLAADLGLPPGQGYTAAGQLGIQLVTLLITIIMATTGGSIAGIIGKTHLFTSLKREGMFKDEIYWKTPPDYDQEEVVLELEEVEID